MVMKYTFEVRVEKKDSGQAQEFVTVGNSVDEVLNRYKSKFPNDKIQLNNNRVFKLSDDWQSA